MSGDNMNPGSPDAVDQGCTCPRIDNGHGYLNALTIHHRGWIVSDDCPIHG